jgi:hypothetical protein
VEVSHRPVADLGNEFVDGAEGHEKPFARLDRLAEPIAGRQIKARGSKSARWINPSSLRAIDVVELVLGHDLDIGQQECRVIARICDPAGNRLAGHPDLVDQLTMLLDVGVCRLAAQNVDGTAFEIIRLGRLAEQRASALPP